MGTWAYKPSAGPGTVPAKLGNEYECRRCPVRPCRGELRCHSFITVSGQSLRAALVNYRSDTSRWCRQLAREALGSPVSLTPSRGRDLAGLRVPVRNALNFHPPWGSAGGAEPRAPPEHGRCWSCLDGPRRAQTALLQPGECAWGESERQQAQLSVRRAPQLQLGPGRSGAGADCSRQQGRARARTTLGRRGIRLTALGRAPGGPVRRPLPQGGPLHTARSLPPPARPGLRRAGAAAMTGAGGPAGRARRAA